MVWVIGGLAQVEKGVEENLVVEVDAVGQVENREVCSVGNE